MATLRLSKSSGESNRIVRVEFHIAAASAIQFLPGVNRLFVSIRLPTLNNRRLDTEVSQTAEWNHTFPSLSLPLSAVVELEIREQRWIRSKLLAITKSTVQDMLKIVNEHKLIVLAMKPKKPHRTVPNLTLSIRVHDLDIAFVSAQLANLALVASPNSQEHFQHVLRRLEYLTRFTAGIAQLHPISNVVYSLAKGIAQTFREHLTLNERLITLLHRIYAVLEFVEVAEPVITIQKFPDVVQDILTCVTHCILFISDRKRASSAIFLLADDKGRVEKLQRELQDLQIKMLQSTTLGLAHIHKNTADEMRAIVGGQHVQKLNPLSMAMVAPDFRTACFPGTRTKVISELTHWGLLSSHKMLWLHAHAGSGKSTISTTVANLFESMGQLGSFVFFNRDIQERSEPSGMIRTIACQLGCHRKDIADGIRSSLEQNSRISELALDVQFQRLLLEPLSRIKVDERLIIIIDALDEGGDSATQDAFLSLLSNGFPQLPDFVRILITSRKYPRIQRTFAKITGLQILDLNEAADVDDDIQIYISAQMDDIRSQYSDLPIGWPGTDVVDSLVQHAHGLFIWATVACAYIKAYNPSTRIQTLLSSPSVRAFAEHSLNGLYTIAIRDAGPWDAEDFASDMHDVLAVIIVSQNPQSSQCISDILGITVARSSELISRLQSILTTDQTDLLHVTHPSVRDYLVDPKRCNPGLPWFLNEPEEHRIMATRCMDYLNGSLKRNVPSDSTDDQSLPDTVAYACVSWIHHVCKSSPTAEFALEIHEFLSKHFLHWLEALSVLGQSRNAIPWLTELQDWYSELDQSDSQLNILLYDGWRFVKAFSKTIETHPSLVYETAMLFCPKNTSISTMFNLNPKITIVSGCLRDWTPSLMTLVGVFMPVESVMFSKSGDVFAACIDGATKVWRTSIGTEILSTPSGPGRWIVSSLLSSDGKRLLEGMSLGSICIWDVDAGKILRTFHIRDGGQAINTRLYCAALAADDVTVVCGFKDGMVQVWNTESGLELTPLLAGHTQRVNTVAFSHNQQMFISGSDDNTVHMWSRTGVHQRTFLGHTDIIHGIAFSPDDSKVVSVSSDTTMKIWDATTGSVLHTCRHSQDELVSAVAFSRRGDRVATGSYHRNIRIWDSETGQELVQPFLGHLGPVIAVAFAPDDKTIISGSLDHHVRIWSLANRRPPVPVQPSHTDHVSCVALANDRTHFASGSADNSLIVWDMDGNVSFSSSHGHSGDITSIDFSPNGKILASGSEDGTVCLWDIVTGQLLGSALQHPDKLVYVKFSTSGSTLATITRDHTLRVWCIPDGILSFESFPDLDRRCRVVTFSHDDSKIATFYNYMASTGLGMIIRDTGNGNILSERRIDSVVHGDELYSVKMEYTADEKYLVVWYALSISARDDFSIRAFDAVTGEEHICQVGYPDFPEFKMPIGINTQIRRNGRKVVELPSDLDYMARITCWDSKGEMIVVGSPSGDTYCITFHD